MEHHHQYYRPFFYSAPSGDTPTPSGVAYLDLTERTIFSLEILKRPDPIFSLLQTTNFSDFNEFAEEEQTKQIITPGEPPCTLTVQVFSPIKFAWATILSPKYVRITAEFQGMPWAVNVLSGTDFLGCAINFNRSHSIPVFYIDLPRDQLPTDIIRFVASSGELVLCRQLDTLQFRPSPQPQILSTHIASKYTEDDALHVATKFRGQVPVDDTIKAMPNVPEQEIHAEYCHLQKTQPLNIEGLMRLAIQYVPRARWQDIREMFPGMGFDEFRHYHGLVWKKYNMMGWITVYF